jgi:hypothetical protein
VWEVEAEEEVPQWLFSLTDDQFGQATFYINLLEERASTLGFPYSSHLGGGLRELRFYVDRQAYRVSYFLTSDRRVVLLTVFSKQRRRERREVERAWRAMDECLRLAHTAEE